MHSLNLLLIIPVVLSISTKLLGLFLTLKYFSETLENPNEEEPSISIIVPVRGLDQGAEENYLSYISQDYSGIFDVIFALESEDDPAIPVLYSLKEKNLNHCSIKVVFSHECSGSGKLKNQIAGIQSSDHKVFVLVDSDVRLKLDFLSKQASNITSRAKTGIAFAVPAAIGSKNWIAALHNISVCASIVNSGMSAQQDKITAAVGSCMVTRRDVIEKIGGLECIADKKVGLDISFSQAVINAGYKLELLRQPVLIHHHKNTLKKLWWQVHRWLVTIRYYYPSLVPIVILLGIPFWWALFFFLTTLFDGSYQSLGIFLVLLTLVTDILFAAIINLLIVKDNRPLA